MLTKKREKILECKINIILRFSKLIASYCYYNINLLSSSLIKINLIRGNSFYYLTMPSHHIVSQIYRKVVLCTKKLRLAFYHYYERHCAHS